MPFLRSSKRHQPETVPAAGPDRPSPTPLDVVFAYHAATKHHPHRFARSLGYMDWETQPNPFRRYHGAPLLWLDEVPLTPGALPDELQPPPDVPPRPVDRASISQLFYDSLALSAWKEFQGQRWSLRVNPSSGNLHPTEGYLVCGPVPGLLDQPAVCHYAPYEHGLEVRRGLPPSSWHHLASQLPPEAVLLGLTSIYWRESWKYGERAFRYCQHDVGHAIGAVALAAAGLGWETRLLGGMTDDELALLLGVHPQHGEEWDQDQRVEAEHADCLLALYPVSITVPDEPRALQLPAALLDELGRQPPAGQPNQLSHDHHLWPIIDAVSNATQLTNRPTSHPTNRPATQPTVPPPRHIIRQRRSAVAMDGQTSIGRETFYRMMERVLPGQQPVAALPWPPAVHLALFIHRVEGLPPGLYFLLRDPAQMEPVRAALDAGFDWQRPPGCPAHLELYRLRAGDYRSVAQAVSCNQEIASQGVFGLGMVAQFEVPLRHHGPWFYRRLHWETGAIGQALYLEAEAAGVRATGIGCFFDDSMHQVLGLTGLGYQTLYHFTVGGAVEDPRLRTVPAYAHRDAHPEAPKSSQEFL